MEKDKFIMDIMVDIKRDSDKELTFKEIEKVIESPYKFAREIIKEIPFREMTLEEFNNTKKNFNIPGLGKLFAKKEIFVKINRLK